MYFINLIFFNLLLLIQDMNFCFFFFFLPFGNGKKSSAVPVSSAAAFRFDTSNTRDLR